MVPYDRCKERGEQSRPLFGHGVPGREIRIIDAFFGILRACYDVHCDLSAISAVLGIGLHYRIFVPVPVEGNDLVVLHSFLQLSDELRKLLFVFVIERQACDLLRELSHACIIREFAPV